MLLTALLLPSLMPKSLKWILLAMTLMLILGTAYRVSWISILDPGLPSGQGLITLIFKGLLVDAKFVAAMGILLWLLGQIPGIHFFKTLTGKKVGLWLVTALFFGALLCLLADFASLASTSRHLNTDILGSWFRSDKDNAAIWRQLPLFPIILIILLATAAFYFLMRFTHRLLHKEHARYPHGNRVISHASFLLIATVLLFGVYLFRLLPENQPAANVLVTNVWQSFFAHEKKMAP